MHSNQKIKNNIWYMKIDPPIWMAAAFESMKVLINDNNNDHDNDNVNVNDNDHVTDKWFVNKPVAIGYNVVKIPDYENLNLEKNGYMKHFVGNFVEWFINDVKKRKLHENLFRK